jgi:hypothetical protein
MKELWEVFLQIGDDPLQPLQDPLGGQLHDLAAQVHDPHHLFPLRHALAEGEEPLTGVVHEIVVLEHLRQLVDLDVADAVDDYCVLLLVFAADAVLVDLLDLADLLRTEVVLSRAGHTSNSLLKCRNCGRSALRLAWR